MHHEAADSAVPIRRPSTPKIIPNLEMQCKAVETVRSIQYLILLQIHSSIQFIGRVVYFFFTLLQTESTPTNQACPPNLLTACSLPASTAQTQDHDRGVPERLALNIDYRIEVDGTKVKINKKFIKVRNNRQLILFRNRLCVYRISMFMDGF